MSKNLDQLEYQSLSLLNFTNIYLATKMNFYKLNLSQISKLTENLLFRNSVLNQEIEKLYPKHGENGSTEHILADSKPDQESSVLFDRCLEYSIDHEFVMKILWHRIYQEPLVMKFISMRHSNYATNLLLDHTTTTSNRQRNEHHSNGATATATSNSYFLIDDKIPIFPLMWTSFMILFF